MNVFLLSIRACCTSGFSEAYAPVSDGYGHEAAPDRTLPPRGLWVVSVTIRTSDSAGL